MTPRPSSCPYLSNVGEGGSPKFTGGAPDQLIGSRFITFNTNMTRLGDAGVQTRVQRRPANHYIPDHPISRSVVGFGRHLPDTT